MVRTVELNQLTEVRAALAPAAVRFALATAAPQARGEHPTPQGFARHFEAVIGRQMFRRQRRPKALVRLARIVLAHLCWFSRKWREAVLRKLVVPPCERGFSRHQGLSIRWYHGPFSGASHTCFQGEVLVDQLG